jgi:hypothetical protein
MTALASHAGPSMSTKLVLSPDQVTAIFLAAKPLRPEQVEDYLHVVAEQLRACPVIGDGTVYRAVEVAQRAFFEPPVLEGCVAKYAR